jgi:hypothetical protein
MDWSYNPYRYVKETHICFLWDFIVNTRVFLAQISEIYQTSESFGGSIARSSVVRRIENIENTYSKLAAINRMGQVAESEWVRRF